MMYRRVLAIAGSQARNRVPAASRRYACRTCTHAQHAHKPHVCTRVLTDYQHVHDALPENVIRVEQLEKLRMELATSKAALATVVQDCLQLLERQSATAVRLLRALLESLHRMLALSELLLASRWSR